MLVFLGGITVCIAIQQKGTTVQQQQTVHANMLAEITSSKNVYDLMASTIEPFSNVPGRCCFLEESIVITLGTGGMKHSFIYLYL